MCSRKTWAEIIWKGAKDQLILADITCFAYYQLQSLSFVREPYLDSTICILALQSMRIINFCVLPATPWHHRESRDSVWVYSAQIAFWQASTCQPDLKCWSDFPSHAELQGWSCEWASLSQGGQSLSCFNSPTEALEGSFKKNFWENEMRAACGNKDF